MSSPTVAVITYTGTLIPDQITTSPWNCASIIFPEYGGIPTKAQFKHEVLQPDYLDSARYRVGGAHFPRFRMNTIIPAVDYQTAQKVARETELCQGDKIAITIGSNPYITCQVVGVISNANVKRVLGASVQGLQGDDAPLDGNAQDAFACVDSEWVLQYIAP